MSGEETGVPFLVRFVPKPRRRVRPQTRPPRVVPEIPTQQPAAVVRGSRHHLRGGAAREQRGQGHLAVATSTAPTTASHHAPRRLWYMFLTRRFSFFKKVGSFRPFIDSSLSFSSSSAPFLRKPPKKSATKVNRAENAPAIMASKMMSGRSLGDHPVLESGSVITSDE